MKGLLIEDGSSLGVCVPVVVGAAVGANEATTVGEEDAEGFGDGIIEGARVGALVGEVAITPTNVSPRNESLSPIFSRVRS